MAFFLVASDLEEDDIMSCYPTIETVHLFFKPDPECSASHRLLGPNSLAIYSTEIARVQADREAEETVHATRTLALVAVAGAARLPSWVMAAVVNFRHEATMNRLLQVTKSCAHLGFPGRGLVSFSLHGRPNNTPCFLQMGPDFTWGTVSDDEEFVITEGKNRWTETPRTL